MNGAHRGVDGLPAWLIPGPCVSGEGSRWRWAGELSDGGEGGM